MDNTLYSVTRPGIDEYVGKIVAVIPSFVIPSDDEIAKYFRGNHQPQKPISVTRIVLEVGSGYVVIPDNGNFVFHRLERV